MPKAFLSHSSQDKKSYVEIVARQLGYHNCVYDDLTFEEGMKPLEEIQKGLDKSDLFVIFLSNSALESAWVKKELILAKNKLSEKTLRRIFPIIIDKKVTYRDSRIATWLREYNLKLVSRPTVATRRIKKRLREISWEYHPRLKEKERIFVGRNELVKTFEERIHSLDLPLPICIIASGLEKIGRKVFLIHSLRKTNIIDDSYSPPLIKLTTNESIEDFILKLYNLGFSEKMDLGYLLKKKVTEKIEIALNIIKDIQIAKEIVFVNDSGCIVTPDRKITDWFKKIIDNIKSEQKITLCLASSFRPLEYELRDFPFIFNIKVPELDKSERVGLLKQYSEFEELNLSTTDLRYFFNLLYGYPEQIYFTVDLLKDYGIERVKNESYLIVEYNTEKVTQVLMKYEKNKEEMDLLYLLANFDFINYDFLFEIIGEHEIFRKLISDFLARAICENLGSNREYIRLNDAICDYIKRTTHELNPIYKQRLEEHLSIFLDTYEEKDEETDLADLVYSIKQALISGKEIDEKFLIPSYFMKTMKEIYDSHTRYNDVVFLADRVLQSKKYLDDMVVKHIRYYLCLSLARLRNVRFLKEVQYISGPEHNFLMGFYYRFIGKNKDALLRLHEALSDRPDFPRAQRELVQVLLNIEDFESAYELAKENYEKNKNNPFHIQAYFRCVIYKKDLPNQDTVMNELLTNLSRINSDQAREMYFRSKAQYYAYCLNNKEEALYWIERAIKEFPELPYPYFTKFEICEKFGNLQDMEIVLEQLNKIISKNSYHYNSLIKNKAIFNAYKKNENLTFTLLKQLRGFPEEALENLRERLVKILKN